MNHIHKAQQAAAVAPAPAGGGAGRWNSPVPFIFTGISLMLLVVISALILLACSYVKSFQPANDTWLAFQPPPPETEPRVAVIMAGDSRPSHLAVPAALEWKSSDSIN